MDERLDPVEQNTKNSRKGRSRHNFKPKKGDDITKTPTDTEKIQLEAVMMITLICHSCQRQGDATDKSQHI